MTKLLALITGNPLVLLWAALAVFAFGAVTGGTVAWKIQGMRITSAQQATKAVQQKFDKYQLDQKAIEQHNKEVAVTQREKEGQAYANLSKELTKAITDGDVYRRCVAAGKCGVRHANLPTCSGNGLSPSSIGNGISAHSVPPGAGATASSEDGGQCQALASDCAVTTLLLNRLQFGIEDQPGYPKE